MAELTLSMSQSLLFSPITLRNTQFRNRLWVAPMCQYSVEKHDGTAIDWHLVHLGSLARGGAGVVMTEATAVLPEGRIAREDLGIWNDEQRDALSRIVAEIHSHGAAAAIQLAHAGRKASVYRPWDAQRGSVPAAEGGWQTFAPTALAFDGYAEPLALDVPHIDSVVEAFAAAARRSAQAGFDAVEIHAAHGYLIHQFLSPLSNKRTDEYGGSAENRARLLLRVIKAVRAEIGDLPLIVRFSADDYAPGGLDANQVAIFARWAEKAGTDLLDISTGGLVGGVHIQLSPGYQVAHAAIVRDAVGIPVSAVGLITEAHQAEDIIRNEQADVVMMGREFLRNPHFPMKAAADLGEILSYAPHQYERAAYPIAMVEGAR